MWRKLYFRLFVFVALGLALASSAQAQVAYVARDFSKFGTVNLTTGVYTEIGTTSVQMDALTFAPNGTLYGMGTDNSLYRIDRANAAATRIGATGTFFGLHSLAARNDGVLFANDSFTKLYRLNAQTGVASFVGEANIPGGILLTGGLAFGPGQTLYSAFVGNTLYSRDQNTGAATRIGNVAFAGPNPGGLFSANNRLYIFDFFGALYALDTTTGASAPTGVTVNGGFGPIHGAAVAPVPGPHSVVVFLTAASGGALALRRRRMRR